MASTSVDASTSAVPEQSVDSIEAPWSGKCIYDTLCMLLNNCSCKIANVPVKI